MSLRTHARRLAATAVAAGTAFLGLTAPAHAATSAPAFAPGDSYVAMGDSYSAGSGVLPLDLSAPLLCVRSTLNYPRAIAQATGAKLKDVTCGGAQTKDFASSQYPGVPPQLNALNGDTKLVTTTIGGNDSSTFINAILACGAAGLLSGGQGSPCKDANGSKFTDTVDNVTYPAIRSALQAVHAKAPQAKVAIIGYPWILPAKADPLCFLKMPIAAGDVPYLRDLQTHLNTAARKAASETGTTYVDMAGDSEGHDACKPSGTRWIEPVLFGTNVVPVHPNALGESKMAQQTRSVLGLG
jgi:lysophospholipase L1-like esterase